MHTHSPRISRRSARAPVGAILTLALALALALAAGCAAKTIPALGKPYPSELPVGAALDVQVFRQQNRLRFTNTSGIVFGEARVWVNAAYSLPITGLAVGQRVDLPLRDFRNDFGQPFRAGGFFATEQPTPVVKAEIVDERGRFSMVVVRDELE